MFIGLSPRSVFPIFYVAMLDEFHWPRAETAAVFSVAMITAAVTMPLTGMLFDKYGPKRVIGGGSILLALGLAASSRVTTIWPLYITYGLVVAFAMNTVSVVTHTTIISNWFSRKSGTAIGIGTVGMGGSYAMAILAQYVTAQYGWRTGYLVLGALVAGIVVPIVLIFQRMKTGAADVGAGHSDRGRANSRAGKEAGWGQQGVTVGAAIGTLQFWLVFATFSLSGYVTFLVSTHQVAYNVDMGYDKLVAAFSFGLFGIANAVTRLGGFLGDRLGKNGAFTIGACSAVVAMVLLVLARDPSNSLILYVYAFLFGLGVGLMAPSLLAATADLYRGRRLGTIMGIMGLAYNGGGAIGPWVGGFIYDRVGRYDLAFYSVMLAIALATICIWSARPSRVPSQQTI